MHKTQIKILIFGLILLGLAVGLIFTPPAQAQATNGVRVLQSDTNRIVLELNVDTYTVRAQRVAAGTFSVITIPGLNNLAAEGKPQLPTQSAMVAIPPGAQAALVITADDARTDPLANPPLPQPIERANQTPRETVPTLTSAEYRLDPAAYNVNRAYPIASARIASTGDWRSQRYVVVEFNPLQYNPITRQLTFHRRLRVELNLTYPSGRTAQALGQALNEGAFETVFQNAFANYSSARTWRAQRPRAPRAVRYTGEPWYKIAVNTDGMYKVTCAQLQSAGMNPAGLNSTATTLQLFDAEIELALNVVGTSWNSTCGASNYIEFFGQAATSKYSNTNVYWLTLGQGTGKRMLVRDGTPSGTPVTVFTDTVRLEENHLYRSRIPWQEGDHWFWNFVLASSSADYVFQTNRFTSSPVSATLTADLSGFLALYSAGGTFTGNLLANGNPITTTTWITTGDKPPQNLFTVAFPQTFLANGSNTITLQLPASSAPIFTNAFDVSFAASLTALTDTLRFQQANAGAWQYPVANFSNATIKAYDVTDPYSVTRFSNTSVTGAGPYTLTFGDTITGAHTYFALTEAQLKTPASITLDASANLRATTNGADYIAIAPTDLLANVQPLINLRTAQGYRTKLVNLQDVYDEFGDGLADPQAIRDFLAYAYTNWVAPAPVFVMLVGDGHFDPRGYCLVAGACPYEGQTPANSTLIPPMLKFVDPWLGETATDNRLVTFGANTLPFMAIGRLPVNNTTELDAMVNKILTNEQNPPNGAWRGTLSFIADNAYDTNGNLDGAGDFWAYSNEVAGDSQLVPLTFNGERVYYNPCNPTTYPWCALPNPPHAPYTTTPSVVTALLSNINAGRLIVNFVGHGSITTWAHETFLRASDIATLTNAGKPPLMLEMTCYTGYFHFNAASAASIAETNVRATNKGALASWAGSGLGVADGHDLLHRGFYQSIMAPGWHQIGPATVAGKQYLFTHNSGYALDLLDTFVLLGDPASRLAFQPNLFLPAILK